MLGDGGDGVTEEVLDIVAAGVVEDLAEVVAHDLDVPVRQGGEDLVEVDLDRPLGALPDGGQPAGAGHLGLDWVEYAHLLDDVHRGTEQVDRVPTGLA